MEIDHATEAAVRRAAAGWQPEGLIPAQAAWVLDNPLRRLISPRGPVLEWAGLRPGMDVLEIGPGPGYFTPALATRVAPGRVYAVELQPGMMVRLRRKLARQSLFQRATYPR